MRRAALIALAAAPAVVAGAGVVGARALSASPAVEERFSAGARQSSCVEVAPDATGLWGAPAYSETGEAWRIEVYADSADCARLANVSECNLRAPARLTYVSADNVRAFNIETIGEHRVRANQHGLSCRRMN